MYQYSSTPLHCFTPFSFILYPFILQLEKISSEIAAQAAEYADLSAKFVIQLDLDFKTGDNSLSLLLTPQSHLIISLYSTLITCHSLIPLFPSLLSLSVPFFPLQ